MSEQMDRLEKEIGETKAAVEGFRDSALAFAGKAVAIIEELRNLAAENNDARLTAAADKLDAIQSELTDAANAMPTLPDTSTTPSTTAPTDSTPAATTTTDAPPADTPVDTPTDTVIPVEDGAQNP